MAISSGGQATIFVKFVYKFGLGVCKVFQDETERLDFELFRVGDSFSMHKELVNVVAFQYFFSHIQNYQFIIIKVHYPLVIIG